MRRVCANKDSLSLFETNLHVFLLSLIFPSPSSLFVFLSSRHSTLISRLELAIPSLLFSLHSSLPSHSRLVTSVRSAESDGRASQHNCAPQHGNGVAEQLNKTPPRLRVIRETNSGCSLLANKALRKAWHPRTDGILQHTAFFIPYCITTGTAWPNINAPAHAC